MARMISQSTLRLTVTATAMVTARLPPSRQVRHGVLKEPIRNPSRRPLAAGVQVHRHSGQDHDKRHMRLSIFQTTLIFALKTSMKKPI